jgi:hypothetical protein
MKIPFVENFFSSKNCLKDFDMQYTHLTPTKVSSVILAVLLNIFPTSLRADDDLANYAAQGNAVGVDGTCFFKRCALETSKCANDPNCLKGLSCLAKYAQKLIL